MTSAFSLRPFEQGDQAALESLVLTIQRSEFNLALTADNQPDLKDVAGFFCGAGSAFWVAVAQADGAVIGCIGLEVIAGPIAIMRKFMVAQAWRGRDLGVALALHSAFLVHAGTIGAPHVALSTVSATKAAQSFYKRLGYQLVKREDMPTGFVPGVLDVVFMVRDV